MNAAMAVATPRGAAWIVVVGASAGGVDSLRRFVAHLPSDLAAAVAVVLHITPNARSLLPQILGRACDLPVAHAIDGMAIEAGTVTVGPPGVHLAIAGQQFELRSGAAENGVRPAVDVLFRTAAATFGPRCVGIVLSGTRDDGAAGLQAIHAAGGVALVQDPDDAAYPSMPEAAIARTGTVHLIAPPEALARSLAGIVAGTDDAGDGPEAPPPTAPVVVAQSRKMPSRFSCPDCGGPLEEPNGIGQPDFRCHVGHAWNIESLDTSQTTEVERALWTPWSPRRRSRPSRPAADGRHSRRAGSRRARGPVGAPAGQSPVRLHRVQAHVARTAHPAPDAGRRGRVLRPVPGASGGQP